ncbi:MAG: Ppx/GppA family phosphatase [Chloroflexota bacterium]
MEKNHRLAVIDLGSNAVRLLLADYVPGVTFRFVETARRRVRLSEGMGREDILRPAAMERTIAALNTFRAHCLEQGAKRIVAVATAAVRDAANREEFLAKIRAEAGLDFRVLTGEEEARLGVIAASNSLGLREGLALEVGGGSAQVSVVHEGLFHRGASFPAGAVRLTESFFKSDPVGGEEFDRLHAYIAGIFEEAEWMTLTGGKLVGLGGAAGALAAIDREARRYPLNLVNGYELELPRLENLIALMRELPAAERVMKLPGLKPDRADIILAGAMVAAAAMRRAGVDRLLVCEQGLRAGIFYQEFLTPSASPVIPDLRHFSVLNVARRYTGDTSAADRAGEIALSFVNQLPDSFSAEDRDCLWASAQLRALEGRAGDDDLRAVILGEGLPGYTHRETVLIALLSASRSGKPVLGKYAGLFERGEEERLARLAAAMGEIN